MPFSVMHVERVMYFSDSSKKTSVQRCGVRQHAAGRRRRLLQSSTTAVCYRPRLPAVQERQVSGVESAVSGWNRITSARQQDTGDSTGNTSLLLLHVYFTHSSTLLIMWCASVLHHYKLKMLLCFM